jgi:hypothetical protein
VRILGRPWRIKWRIQRAIQAAVLGTHRYGKAVSARHGIGIVTQFVQILAESTRSGISFDEFYLHQMYLPDRWRSRKRRFGSSKGRKALLFLNQRNPSPQLQLLDEKHRFAAHCKQVGLPSAPLLAVFAEGHPDRKLEGLPARHLFSKPAFGSYGEGAISWRYDQSRNCFFNAENDEKFSQEALVKFLCNLSWSGRVILQEGLTNHAALLPFTNGALSTLRIITCLTPFASIDIMPPVFRMPVGRLVVDNFARGGLLAPVDLATGTICGPVLQKDKCLGVVQIDTHPDSGQKFGGFPVPRWTEAVALARRAHQTVLSVPFIGWDIAILQHGPVLVEANTLPDTDIVLPHGLTLSDTQLIPYFKYHWANSVQRGRRDS